MMKLLRLRFGARLARVIGAREDDRGMALATVIIFGTVLLMMSATIVSVSVSGNTHAQKDSNWVAAGQAAYAGVEDYQSKLANDNSYAKYGSIASPFSAGSQFSGINNNNAFTTGSSTTWQPVDPSQKPGTDPSYRYAVNNSQYAATGSLSLQVTGRVNGTTRTVVANLKQSGFLDYLYFTDLEYTDPAIDTDCPKTSTYQWAATLSGNCNVIQFASGDTIAGPAHSNDTLNICGSHFLNTLSTSNPAANVATSKGYTIPSGCSLTATIDKGGNKATYSPLLQMPATITSLIQETRSDLTNSTVLRPGCLYTGPTTFSFNANGTWTVYSPWTQYTNVTGSPISGGNNDNSAQCGSPGYSKKGNTLGSPGGQTFTVVPNNLVYVQNVPTSSSDPNYPNANSTSFSGGKFFASGLPQSYTCTGGDGKTAGNGVGYPANGESAPSSASYGCQNGDAFVSGTVTGQVTIAANNYAYITGDIVYGTTSNDNLLGIIGQNNVYVYNPVQTVSVSYKCNSFGQATSTGSSTCKANQLQLMDRSKSDRTIDAAIMSVGHSFTVENYSADGNGFPYTNSTGYPKGNLNVLGSIVQKYRGPVATSAGNGVVGTGYTKNYLYDSRLAFEAPPKFLSPVSTSYGITSVTDVKTAVSATGANL